MFFKVVLVAIVVTAVLGKPWTIERHPDGSYDWKYQNQNDGSGQLQQAYPVSDGSIAIKGKAKWYDPEGKFHLIEYQADENGAIFNSDDIPHANWNVTRALIWNAEHPEEE